jgi:hypothetical protein
MSDSKEDSSEYVLPRYPLVIVKHQIEVIFTTHGWRTFVQAYKNTKNNEKTSNNEKSCDQIQRCFVSCVDNATQGAIRTIIVCGERATVLYYDHEKSGLRFALEHVERRRYRCVEVTGKCPKAAHPAYRVCTASHDAMGDVEITKHAWERFCVRAPLGDKLQNVAPDSTYRFILTELRRSFARSRRVNIQKRRRVERLFKNHLAQSLYYHDRQLGLRFVVVENGAQNALYRWSVWTIEIPKKEDYHYADSSS